MSEYNITILQKNESGTLDTYYPRTIADQVEESEEKLFLRADDKAVYDANVVYTNNTPIVQPQGQIEAGDTFSQTPVNQILTKLLYPYVAPQISGSASVASRVVEKGVTTTVSSVTAAVVKKSEAITNVSLYNGSTLVEAKTDDVASGGSITFTQSIPITDTATLKVKATDAKPTTVEAEVATYTYVYPMYHGTVADASSIDGETVAALVKDVCVKGSRTYNFDLDNTCAVFAYPAAYGDLTKISDVHGFNNLPAFTKSTVNVTGTDGTTQSYYVYAKDPATATGFALTFEF